MSYKTSKLTALFPDAYAAADTGSVLFRLLDAFGAELGTADAKIKDLLKSHWVRYATGPALDGLGALLGVERRLLGDASPESDESFRRRLMTVVPLFAGGGTVKAVLGAVRSALGLPTDVDQVRLPPEFRPLLDDLSALVTIEEFAPLAERVLGSGVAEVDGAAELILTVDVATTGESLPAIDWTFDTGGGRRLSLERTSDGLGVKSVDGFVVPPGATLNLAADADGRLVATLAGADVSPAFVNLNGSAPAVLPTVPVTRSEWKFRARGGVFDLGAFDVDGFDPPGFHVELRLTRFQPLTFDVTVPYFLQAAVAALRARYHYPGELLVFKGLPPERIQAVVDQVRAAGVRGSIRFSLNFFESHEQREAFVASGELLSVEDAGASEALLASSVNDLSDAHGLGERLTIGSVFDVTQFDGDFGFL